VTKKRSSQKGAQTFIAYKGVRTALSVEVRIVRTAVSRYGVVKPRWRLCGVSGKGVVRLRARSRLFKEGNARRMEKSAEAISARGRAPYRAVDVEGEELESHGGSG
jgi:hypothetical protein